MSKKFSLIECGRRCLPSEYLRRISNLFTVEKSVLNLHATVPEKRGPQSTKFVILPKVNSGTLRYWTLVQPQASKLWLCGPPLSDADALYISKRSSRCKRERISVSKCSLSKTDIYSVTQNFFSPLTKPSAVNGFSALTK